MHNTQAPRAKDRQDRLVTLFPSPLNSMVDPSLHTPHLQPSPPANQGRTIVKSPCPWCQSSFKESPVVLVFHFHHCPWLLSVSLPQPANGLREVARRHS